MPALDSGVFAYWVNKQTARGTAATVGKKKLRKVGGGIDINRAMGREAFGDGKRFSTATDYTDTIQGGGDPVIQGQVGPAAYLAYLYGGTDTFSGAGPYTHAITPNNSGGPWVTMWKTVGSAVGPIRQRYADGKVTQLVIESSAANKTLHITPTLLFADPAEVIAADVAQAFDADEPFLWTEATGQFNFDGGGAGVVGEVNQLNLTLSDNVTPWYGDNVLIDEIVPGRSDCVLNYTVLLTDVTLPTYNKIHYGTAAPVATTKPVKTVFYGSLLMKFTRGSAGTLRELRIQIPKLAYSTDVAIEGLPDGGPVEMPLVGMGRDDGTNPMWTITGINNDNAQY
jgi:hypothetical protein